MRRMNQTFIKKGFTLVELIVVIAIIGLLSTLAVLALNSAREKSRDARRVAIARQVQIALELYYADQNSYPTIASPGVVLGAGNQQALCSNGGWKAACAGGDTTYMAAIPTAPTPADGSCTASQNGFTYTSVSGTSYALGFCLGSEVGTLKAGARTADQNGIQ